MKKSLLNRWCEQPWLHATYFLGIVMLNVFILNWEIWDVPQKLILQPQGKELNFTFANGRALVEVDRVDIHNIIQIETIH